MTSDFTIVKSGHHGIIRTTFISNNSTIWQSNSITQKTCNRKYICLHVLLLPPCGYYTECPNAKLVKHRTYLMNLIFATSTQLQVLNTEQLFTYLIACVEVKITYYFAVFLDKSHKIFKQQNTKKIGICIATNYCDYNPCQPSWSSICMCTLIFYLKHYVLHVYM